MTSAGAASATADQMRSTLHATLPPDRLHAAFNVLDTQLSRQQVTNARPVAGQVPLMLRQANSLWGQRGHAFRPSFLDVLAQQYGAGLRLVDFQTAPEPSRARINAWVSEQTEQKIKDLLPPQSVTPATRLVLVNAIYFKAKWQQPFDPGATQDGSFTRLDGSRVTARMMNQTSMFRYAAGPDYQAVQLEYSGDANMIVLLPTPGKLHDFETGLTTERLQQILDDLQP